MKLKWPTLPPPSFQALRIGQLCVAGLCAGLGVYAHHVGDNIAALIDAFCAGFNVAGAISTTFQIRAQRHFDRMFETCDSMMQLNHELIVQMEGQSEVIRQINGQEQQRPSLH